MYENRIIADCFAADLARAIAAYDGGFGYVSAAILDSRATEIDAKFRKLAAALGYEIAEKVEEAA